MGTSECSQPASKSSWDSQDINMVLKMARFRKSTGPRWVKLTLDGRAPITPQEIMYTCNTVLCLSVR